MYAASTPYRVIMLHLSSPVPVHARSRTRRSHPTRATPFQLVGTRVMLSAADPTRLPAEIFMLQYVFDRSTRLLIRTNQPKGGLNYTFLFLGDGAFGYETETFNTAGPAPFWVANSNAGHAQAMLMFSKLG